MLDVLSSWMLYTQYFVDTYQQRYSSQGVEVLDRLNFNGATINLMLVRWPSFTGPGFAEVT